MSVRDPEGVNASRKAAGVDIELLLATWEVPKAASEDTTAEEVENLCLEVGTFRKVHTNRHLFINRVRV